MSAYTAEDKQYRAAFEAALRLAALQRDADKRGRACTHPRYGLAQLADDHRTFYVRGTVLSEWSWP